MSQHKSEKSLKLNMVLNAVKGMVSIIFPLITFPYVSTVFGVENMGKYNFTHSVVNYFVLLAALGINIYAVREGAALRDEKSTFAKFANEIFSINLLSSITAYLIFILFLAAVPKFHEYSALLMIFSIQIFFQPLGVEWIYSIYEDYAFITIRSIVFNILSLILLFIFVKDTSSLNTYAVITVFSCVGSNIFNVIHSKKYCKLKITYRMKLEEHLKPIMTFFFMQITTTIYVESDAIILGFLCGDYNVGLYSVSSKVYSIIKAVLSSVMIVSIPRISAIVSINDKENFIKIAEDIYTTLLTVLIPAICGIIILRKEIILLISDERFISASLSLLILSVSVYFGMGAYFWSKCVLIPFKEENTVFKATLVSAAVNIILNFVLMPIWKENAAAVTTLIAEGIVFIWCMLKAQRRLRLKKIKVIYLKILIGCAAFTVISYVIKLFHLTAVVYTALTISISVIIYFSVELLLRNEAVLNVYDSLKQKIRRKF